MISRESATIPRNQRVVHALVVHGYAVTDTDGVELQGTRPWYTRLHLLGEGIQMHVAGDQFVERVGDADERLADVPAIHS